MASKRKRSGLGIAFGVALGAAAAVILGSSGLWLAIGIAVGIAIGAALARDAAKANDQRLTTNDSPLTND